MPSRWCVNYKPNGNSDATSTSPDDWYVLKLKKDTAYFSVPVCECTCLQRKGSFASPSCNQSLLNEAGLDTPQWQQSKGSVCILFLEHVTRVYTYAHDKEDVFIPIWAGFNTVRHADRHVHAHTHRRMPGPPAAQGFQTTISCSALTNHGTKAVMSQLLQTHLKHSPDWLTADGRDR